MIQTSKSLRSSFKILAAFSGSFFGFLILSSDLKATTSPEGITQKAQGSSKSVKEEVSNQKQTVGEQTTEEQKSLKEHPIVESEKTVEQLKAQVFQLTHESEVSAHLVEESVLSFLHLQAARESFNKAQEHLGDILLIEYQKYEQERLLEDKLLKYREARDYNYSIPYEIFLYTIGFKFLWGAFTQYSPTTFSANQFQELEEQKVKKEEAFKELEQRLLVAKRSLNIEIARFERGIDDAYEKAVTSEEQLQFKNLKYFVLRTLNSRREAQTKFLFAYRLFRENIFASLNAPNVTLETRARVMRLLNQTHFDIAAEKVPNIQAFIDLRVFFRFKGLLQSLKDFEEAYQEFMEEKSSFKTKIAFANSTFEDSFSVFETRNSKLDELYKMLRKTKEQLENSSQEMSAEQPANFEVLQGNAEDHRKEVSQKQRLFQDIMLAFEESERAIALFEHYQFLQDQQRKLDYLLAIKRAELEAQEQAVNGSLIREIFSYTIGLKFLIAPFKFLVNIFRQGRTTSQVFRDSFGYARITPEAQKEFLEYQEFYKQAQEKLQGEINQTFQEFETKKNRLDQIYALAQETFDKSTAYYKIPFAARGRATLQKLYLNVLKAFSEFEKGRKQFNIIDSEYREQLDSSKTDTSGVYKFENLLDSYAAFDEQQVYAALLKSQQNREKDDPGIVNDMYQTINYARFLKNFRVAKAEFENAKMALAKSYEMFREEIFSLLKEIQMELDTLLQKQRVLEQQLLNAAALEAVRNPEPVSNNV